MKISSHSCLLFCFLVISTFFAGIVSLGDLDLNSNFDSDEGAAFFENEDRDDGFVVESTHGFFKDEQGRVTEVREDGAIQPTPPSIIQAPLAPLPEMSASVAKPPGFGPPPSFRPRKLTLDEKMNLGFVIHRRRSRVMGLSRRKLD